MFLRLKVLQKVLQTAKFKLNSHYMCLWHIDAPEKGLKLLTIFFSKTSILDVWKGSEYAPALGQLLLI